MPNKKQLQKKEWDCWTAPSSPLCPRSRGAPRHPSWCCQWPSITTKPPNTQRWGRKQPFSKSPSMFWTRKTSLATVKDFNSFTEREWRGWGLVVCWPGTVGRLSSIQTMFEALDTSLVFIQKLLRPLCLSRLCHIDTQPFWHYVSEGQRKWLFFCFSSVWTICFVLFFSWFHNFHQIWRRPPSKGKQ